MNTLFVALLAWAEEGALPYLRVDETGRILMRGVRRPGDPAPGERVVLLTPGGEALARWIDLPARNPVQAAAAAALLLEAEIAAPAAEAHVAVGPVEADGLRLAVVVDRARLRAWLDQAAAFGLDPDVVAPDYLALPESEGAVTVLDFGGTVAARGARFAFSAEADLAEVILGDRPRQAVPAGEREAVLAAGAAALTLNLRQNAFARGRTARVGRRDLRRAAALAAILALSPVVLQATTIVRDTLAAAELEARAAARAAAVAPGVRIEDPVARTDARLARLRAGQGFAAGAAALFRALEPIEGAQVESFVYASDGAVRATIGHVNYSDLELMRRALAEAGLSLEEDATANEGDRILTDVVVRAKS